MDKELPNTNNGRSAFTVFGYGGDRYTELFDSPMEDPPESFNATNSIAFPSRPSRKGRGRCSLDAGDARKLRLGGQDNPHLVLQSLGSSGEAFTGVTAGDTDILRGKLGASTLLAGQFSAEGQEGKAWGRMPRRYSASQAGDSPTTAAAATGLEDNSSRGDGARLQGISGETHTDQFLQMLSSTVTSTGSIYTPGKARASHTDLVALAQGPQLLEQTKPRPLVRQGSSPVLSSLAQHDRLDEQSKGSLLGYLPRNASTSALTSLGEARLQEYSTLRTSSISEEASSAGVVSPCPVAAASGSSIMGSSVDSPDSAVAAKSNSRFGAVLARTRKFGAWLGKVTEGEKIEVTKKDLNVFAPTSF